MNDETCSLEYFDSYDAQQRSMTVDPRYATRYHQSDCVETAMMNAPCEIEDSGGSDSANSLDDLCGRNIAIDDVGDRFNQYAAINNNLRDQYMVPTRSPRELNARILSLFNPQFLPNFNNMITYMAGSPPPRSQSVVQYSSEDDNFQRGSSTNYRKRDGTNSMCFRRGLTYDTPRK